MVQILVMIVSDNLMSLVLSILSSHTPVQGIEDFSIVLIKLHVGFSSLFRRDLKLRHKAL